MANIIKYTELDPDGNPVLVERELIEITAYLAITPKEFIDTTVTPNTWVRITSEPESDLTCWKVKKTRAATGNVVPYDAIAGDKETANIQDQLKPHTAITPSATESAGIVTTVEAEKVTDLISTQRTTTKRFLDEASFQVSIPMLIPERFRGIIPTNRETHIVAGTAAEPVLAAGEFERLEKQVDKLLKQISVLTIASVTLPVILSDKAIDKNGLETTIKFTFDDNEQTINAGSDPTFSQGELTHIGAGYTLLTEVFDTLPSPWRVNQEPDKDGAIVQIRRRKNLSSAITPVESVTAGVWKKVSKEGENGTIADEIEYTRTVAT